MEQLLNDCYLASDCNEQRLSQLRDQQASLEAHIAHLTERLTLQTSLLKNCTRGGGSILTHRLEATSSRDSKKRSFSTDPNVRFC